jgi:hypothetical protein
MRSSQALRNPKACSSLRALGESATLSEELVSMWILLSPKAGTRQSDELTLCCKRLQFRVFLAVRSPRTDETR